LFEIQKKNVLADLKRSEFYINEQIGKDGKDDRQAQDRNHRHLFTVEHNN
jgi:hypothetical protein